MEAAGSSTLTTMYRTSHHRPEGNNRHGHHSKNLKSLTISLRVANTTRRMSEKSQTYYSVNSHAGIRSAKHGILLETTPVKAEFVVFIPNLCIRWHSFSGSNLYPRTDRWVSTAQQAAYSPHVDRTPKSE
jgi:hypothetical protein